jgi:hypothetical protein
MLAFTKSCSDLDKGISLWGRAYAALMALDTALDGLAEAGGRVVV